jgi:hypothetical protein
VNERIIEFQIETGERVLLRVSQIMCLFPEHRQIRTVEHGWTLTVHPDCWLAVVKAFQSMDARMEKQ